MKKSRRGSVILLDGTFHTPDWEILYITISDGEANKLLGIIGEIEALCDRRLTLNEVNAIIQKHGYKEG